MQAVAQMLPVTFLCLVMTNLTFEYTDFTENNANLYSMKIKSSLGNEADDRT